MNVHTVAVLFVIGCTPSSVFSSDVAGRHHQALQSKKNSVGGSSDNYSLSTAIDRCIKGFTGTYTYAADCYGVAFMASLGCTKGICDYSESQFADVTVCPDSEIRQPSKCVLSGTFDATKHIDPNTCEVKVFKVAGDENCNFQEFATTPTGVGINPNEYNDDGSIGIYFERMDNVSKKISPTKDDINKRRLEQNFVGVLYSKSVDDHHRYLANGDVTTGDKMKVLDVHRRRLQCGSPKIAIVYYSRYGHVRTLALWEKKGLESAGCDVTLLRWPLGRTEPGIDGLDDAEVSAANLADYDGLLFGFPTRYGMTLAQVKELMDSTVGLVGKPAGLFFSVDTRDGDQETTALTFKTHLTDHEMVFVPLGLVTRSSYNYEVHGGRKTCGEGIPTPCGAGTLIEKYEDDEPSTYEKVIAHEQGALFCRTAAKPATK